MSRRTPGTALTAMGETGARFSDDGGGGARPSAPARSTAKTMAPRAASAPRQPFVSRLSAAHKNGIAKGPTPAPELANPDASAVFSGNHLLHAITPL